MSSLFQSTLNTRPLPTGEMRFIRSDFPEKLTDEEVKWLRQNHVTKGQPFVLHKTVEKAA